MLHFFRHIRRSFFPLRQEGSAGHVLPGKVRTYLAYAFGEIVLIVVGILIAVEIGDWNQARKEEKLKDRYIVRLIDNIQSDTEVFEIEIRITEMRVGFSEFLMQLAKDPELVKNRTVEFLAAVTQSGKISNSPLNSGTYEDLISTGSMSLLKDEVKNTIHSYYRIDARMRQTKPIYDSLSIQYNKLRKGVLSIEQENWMEDNFGVVIFRELSTVQTSTYDDENSDVESAYRLQNKENLIQLLPQMRAGLLQANVNHNNRLKLANELLEILQTELAP